MFGLRYILQDFPIILPWHINGLPSLGILFLGGYWYRQYGSVKSTKVSIIICVVLFAIGCIGFFTPIDATSLSVICPAFLALSICQFCSTRANQFDLKFLRWFSINGIVILGLHDFCYGYYHALIKHVYVIASSDWLSFSAYFVLVFFTLFFILVPAMNKYGYRVIGKKKLSWTDSYHI